MCVDVLIARNRYRYPRVYLLPQSTIQQYLSILLPCSGFWYLYWHSLDSDMWKVCVFGSEILCSQWRCGVSKVKKKVLSEAVGKHTCVNRSFGNVTLGSVSLDFSLPYGWMFGDVVAKRANWFVQGLRCVWSEALCGICGLNAWQKVRNAHIWTRLKHSQVGVCASERSLFVLFDGCYTW